MIATMLSILVAAFVAASGPPQSMVARTAAARAARAESAETMPPIYRYVNQHYIEIDQTMYECWDFEQSDDGGQTWTFLQEVCEPVGLAG